MKAMKIILALTLLLLQFCTKSSHAGDDSAQKSLLISALQAGSEGILTPERESCYRAVLIMNQCVGAGNGFQPAIMCSSSSTFTLDDYMNLEKCVALQVQTTYCNFPQNKAADPRVALDNFFSSCQKDALGNDANIIIPSF